MIKQLRKEQMKIILKLMKDVDFEDMKTNYAITRNERIIKKEVKEIEADLQEQEGIEARTRTVIMSNTVPYEVDFYTIKKIPDTKELTIKQALLLQLFLENPKEYKFETLDTTERFDYTYALPIAHELRDVSLNKETAMKVAANIVSMMQNEELMKDEEVYNNYMKYTLDFELLRVSLLKKDIDGNLDLDKEGNPQFKNEEQAEKKLKAFNAKHKDLQKSYDKWMNKEKVDFKCVPISFNDLPEDITKKQMEVLLPFIKEEE